MENKKVVKKPVKKNKETLEFNTYKRVVDSNNKTVACFVGDKNNKPREISEQEYNNAVFLSKKETAISSSKSYAILLFTKKGCIFMTDKENDEVVLADTAEKAVSIVSNSNIQKSLKKTFLGYSVVLINRF